MTTSVRRQQPAAPPLVEGTVVDVRREADEPPDADPANTLFKLIVILDVVAIAALVLLPIALVFVLVMMLLAFLGVAVVASPIASLGCGAALSLVFPLIPRPGQHNTEKVPVVYLRVHETTGVEHDVRMKGFLKTGSVAVGDVLRIWGRRRLGVVFLEKALNVRTRAWVDMNVKHRGTLLGALVMVNMLVLILLWMSVR